MPYSSEQYLNLFEASFLETETAEERFEALRHHNVVNYRVKTYRMGDVLECEIFPVWNTQKEASRAKKVKRSRPAQEKLNHRNTQKKIVRLTNNNFTGADLWVTFGYDKNAAVPTLEQARRDIINYLRRIKRWRKKQGLPPLRYIYVTEVADKDGNPVRPHHHLIMSGDMDRDFIENEWHGGAYPQARRLRPKDQGLTGLALYISKGRHWGCSKNLKMPRPTVADKKFTKRQVQKIAINRNTAPDFFKSIFKGFDFRDTERDLDIRHSNFVSGAYIYATMYRAAPPPQQQKEDFNSG